MLKWLLTLSVVGALAAAVAWAPIRGRTILQRWRAAPSATAFAERSASEVKSALGFGASPRDRVAAKGQKPRAKSPPARTAPPTHPTESHTAEDRAALDRLVAERAGR